MLGVPYQYTLSRILRARLDYLRETFHIKVSLCVCLFCISVLTGLPVSMDGRIPLTHSNRQPCMVPRCSYHTCAHSLHGVGPQQAIHHGPVRLVISPHTRIVCSVFLREGGHSKGTHCQDTNRSRQDLMVAAATTMFTACVQEDDYLAFDAVRQAAQCVGRVIRSKADYGGGLCQCVGVIISLLEQNPRHASCCASFCDPPLITKTQVNGFNVSDAAVSRVGPLQAQKFTAA